MYKLPLINLHNVQQYKLFGILKGLADLKMKICHLVLNPFVHIVPNLYGFLKYELEFGSGPHTNVLYGFRRLYMEIFYHMKGLIP